MKVSIIAAVALANTLFELELDTISQEPEFHFEFNDWNDKYPGSINHQEQLTSSPENEFNAAAIQELAKEIQNDFESGYWNIDEKESGLYNYMMPMIYGKIITKAFGQQLAMITRVGIQQEIKFL